MLLNKSKRFYDRPAYAKSYIQAGHVLADPYPGSYRTEQMIIPALAKLRPQSFNHFQESTAITAAEAAVVCSGNVILSEDLKRIGITVEDAKIGEYVECVTRGRVFMQLEHASAAAHTSSLTDLNGKIAYYDKDTGKVTEVDTGADGFAIGRFAENSPSFKPHHISVNTSGIYWILVDLDQVYNTTAVTLPTDAATTFTDEIALSVREPHLVGLTQTFELDASNSNPAYPVKAADITWTIDGTEYKTGWAATHTFSAGAANVVVTVDNGSSSATATWGATYATDAAPASWTKA